MLDVELDAPPAGVALEPDETGIGLLLRVRGRPVHFSLHEVPPASRLSFAALWRLVGRQVAAAVLADAVRDELSPPAQPPAADLTIAVCTRARTDALSRCVDSILALRGTTARLELLVVDNAPPDDATERLVRSLEEVRYVREPRPGLDFARNRALAEATGEFVAFLDDDVVADREWLQGLEEAIAANPDAGAITGLVLPLELSSAAQVRFERTGGFGRGFRKLRWEGADDPANALYPAGPGIFGAGCNMVFRRSALRDLGGFDEALDTGPPLPGGGDLDAFYRIVRAGLPLVYEPRMLVFHAHRREHDALRRQYWSWGAALMAFVAKAYATDVEMRPRLRGMTAWWTKYALHGVRSAVRGPSRRPVDLALAELAGGVTGLAGGYARSVRRTEVIRRAHG